MSPADFRAALEQALEAADSDERVGPLVRASGLRMRFEFPDADMALNVEAVEGGDRHIRWSFGEVEWEPRLALTMDSDVANRYLQGSESLPIAIARGQVRVDGESRVALLYLPIARLLCAPYREVVTSEYPTLAA